MAAVHELHILDARFRAMTHSAITATYITSQSATRSDYDTSKGLDLDAPFKTTHGRHGAPPRTGLPALRRRAAGFRYGFDMEELSAPSEALGAR